MNGDRPYISSVRRRVWLLRSGGTIPGIALHAGPKLIAHLTPAEALSLSNQLTDLAERIEVEAIGRGTSRRRRWPPHGIGPHIPPNSDSDGGTGQQDPSDPLKQGQPNNKQERP